MCNDGSAPAESSVMRLIHLGLLSACVSACSGGPSKTDATGGNGAAGANGTPATCTSQMYWMGGDMGSELMHPGGGCLTCHSNSPEAPRLSIAGTVYPTSHEPDDCNGVSGSLGISVVITDATGTELPPITVNEVGNFHFDGRIAAPFHVKVVSGGRENVMSAAPANGECNGCHTRKGANGAPGRILAP
jgi:hypothetical protein